MGCMGYIAFSGNMFKEHYAAIPVNSSARGLIEQNFLNMYEYNAIPAIIIRILIYI